MERSNLAFRCYLAIAAVGVSGYFLLPPATQNVALIVSNLVAVVAIVVSWRRRRLTPTSGWLLLAAFPAATAIGNIIYFVDDSILGVNPFPSVGDASFLAGYVLLAAGLLRIQHARATDRDTTAVLDVAIITVGFAAASWVFFMAPLLAESGTPLLERLVAVGYPVGDVLVLAVTARFFLTARRRGPVFAWLAGTVVVMLVADTLFAWLNLQDLYATGHPVDALILTYNLGWGAVALHRDAGDLTQAAPQRPARPTWSRLAALATASLVPAVVLLVQVLRGDLREIGVVAGAGLLLFLLVMARMSAIVLTLERVLRQRTALEREVAATTVERNRMASIVTSSSDAIVGLSLDGVVTSWNPAAERLYGRPAASALDEPQDIVTAEQFELLRSGFEGPATESPLVRAAADGSQEIQVERADGSTVPVSLTFSPIRTGQRLTGVSVIGQDVTERRRAEAALRDARAEALEASRLKSEFLATMSHEIRTPMNAVIGLTGLLLETSLDDLQRQYATGVQSASQALLVVINDILDFSKLEAGKVDLELRDFDPRSVVDEVGALLARDAEAKGLELIAYCVPDVPVVLTGDAGRIRQVLLNLASNAVKFTSSGEVVIKLQTTMGDDGSVLSRFEVADTGIGIPAESHQRLFESFSQADASTTRRFGGTGLGLAISLRLVEAMGGVIGLDSEAGVGSRFWFQLPLRLSASDDDRPAPHHGLRPGLRILVVDDNVTTGSVLSAQLTSWGADVDTVVDGTSALGLMNEALAQARPYDIAILDLVMPDLGGLQLAQAIAADSGLRRTRTLMMTSVLRVDAAALTRAGVDCWLTKPVATSTLRHQLEQLVSGPPPTAAESTVIHQDEVDERPRPRVLVVEDNALNQLVAEGVLIQLGYHPDLVANGAEALAAISGGEYAAVLMDCHMPVMDGYEATREIRRREGGGRHTPVIAMTASATTQDRERALASGMDDYVSKPIVVQVLAEVLERWIGQQPLSLPVLDLQRLATLRELGERRGADLVTKLVDLFERDATGAVAEIRAAVDEHDRAALEAAAHRLKGAASNLGVTRVAARCQRLESCASGAVGLDDTEVESLSDELQAALAALRSTRVAG